MRSSVSIWALVARLPWMTAPAEFNWDRVARGMALHGMLVKP